MRLKEWRTLTTRKQAEIAEAIGVTVSQYSKIERGETWTSPSTAEKLMEYTAGAVTPNDLHEVWREYQAGCAA